MVSEIQEMQLTSEEMAAWDKLADQGVDQFQDEAYQVVMIDWPDGEQMDLLVNSKGERYVRFDHGIALTLKP